MSECYDCGCDVEDHSLYEKIQYLLVTYGTSCAVKNVAYRPKPDSIKGSDMNVMVSQGTRKHLLAQEIILDNNKETSTVPH